ncbi:MAG: hypothetical protein M1331_03645 [Candidatus Marsarchaeota archaeon]|nr:hypothetical protein [Candidatus Marsarchaeota archaeon]MCL5106461.1 hypothetical protein [Candidatus Marsarchaeota archaeon]
MQQFISFLVLYAFASFAVIFAAMFFANAKKDSIKSSDMRKAHPLRNQAAFFFASLALAAAVSMIFYNSAFFAAASLAVSSISFAASFFYSRSSRIFVFAIALLLAIAVYLTFLGYLQLFIQVFPIATILGFISKNSTLRDFERDLKIIPAKKSIKAELQRDVFQIFIGLLIILILIYAQSPVFVIVLLTLLSYLLINIISFDVRKGNRIADALKQLERINTVYGTGAIYLACSALLILGFVGNLIAIIGLAAIFFADSMATIIGMTFKSISLPYNNRKTMAGSAAFFAVLFAFETLLGVKPAYAVLISFALAVVESLKFEDNLSLMLAVIAISFAISAA